MSESRREKAIGRLLLLAFVTFFAATFVPQISLSDATWAVVLLLYALASGVAALVLAKPLTIRLRIIALAICYIALVIGFASIHFLLYRYDPDAYVFADAVSAVQLRATVRDAQDTLVETNAELGVLNDVARDADVAYFILAKDNVYTLANGASLEIAVETYAAGFSTFTTHRLIIRTPAGKYTIYGDIAGDARAEAVYAVTEARGQVTLRVALHALINAIRSQQLRAESVLKHGLPVWRYVDFLYFSAVTLSTLGYGDILPATRISRLLVACEATGGVLLIAFALAFMWPTDNGTDRSDASPDVPGSS